MDISIKNKKNAQRESFVGWSFIMPTLILLAAFTIIPIIVGVYYSFTKFKGTTAPEWIGLRNYIKLFSDESFLAALKNTIFYIILTVPALTIIPLFIAEIIAKKFPNKFGEFVRGVLFIPVVCSASLISNIWYYIFMADSDSLANTIIGFFGLPAVSWLNGSVSAFLVVCFVFIWKNTGYFLVIYYAAIMDIPVSIYEAAALDGATPWQQFWNITVPNIKSILYLVLTMSTIWTFQAFDITYVMTKGGPALATNTLTLEVYTAFGKSKMGYASAIAIILTILVLIVTMIQRSAFKEKVMED